MFNSIYVVSKIGAENTTAVKTVVDSIRNSIPMLTHTTGRDIKWLETVNDLSFGEGTLTIAVGGDGTMLEALRISAVSGAVAMGVNLGNVGFLTDFVTQTFLPNTLYDIFNDNDSFPIEERMSLTILDDVTTGSESVDPIVKHRLPIAFNEFALAHRDSDSMIRYRLRVDNTNAGYHRANSLIVSTPTGSTAYSLSAGGSLIIPNLEVMQITPVAPPTLTSRPIIVGASSTVIIDAETNGGLVLRADGRIIGEWKQQARVAITSHQAKAKILHTPDWNFFTMLTQKLGWQQNR